MKGKRYSEERIIRILQEVDSGLKVNEVCRNHGISQATYYQWKAMFSGMAPSQLKHLKELESELSQYRRMYAELANENYALKDVGAKGS